MISLYETNDSTSDLYENKRSPFTGFVNNIYLLVVLLLLIIVVGGSAYIFYTYSHYIDFSNNCTIEVQKDIVSGNRQTIFDALKLIKEDHPEDYENICTQVDTIVETECILGDKKTPKIHYLDTDGCYLKGTKTIFIRPVSGTSDTIVENRAELILKYGTLSGEYWQSH